MVVQHNVTAMNASRMLGITTTQQSKQSEKLASGYRINRAADDAAGLSISEKMRSQIKGLNKASTNAQDGISLIQVAEGALNETHSILQRMNELATQAANDTNVSVDRTAIAEEMTQLKEELSRIATTTEFNDTKILAGSFKNKNFQVGAKAGQSITISINDLSASGSILNLSSISASCVKDHATAKSTMTDVQNAIKAVSTERAKLGAIQNRLEHTVDNLNNIAENTQAAESRLRDTDMAASMVEYSKNQILSQAGQSMLAQANTATQGVLSLLQ